MASLLLSYTSSSYSWLLYFVLFLVPLVLAFSSKRRGKSHIKRHPPGPSILPRMLCLLRIHFFGLPQHFLWQIAEKYGPIIHMKMCCLSVVVVSSAETAKEILKTHDLNFCNRYQTHCIKKLSYNSIAVAVGDYNEYWRELRKFYVVNLLSPKSVQSLRSVREKEVSSLTNSIRSSIKYSSPKIPTVNLDEKIFLHTLNITYGMLFGTSYQGRKNSEICKFDEVISESMETVGSLSASDMVPYIGWLIDVITGQHARVEKNFHALDFYLEQFIREYLDPNRVKPVANEGMIDALFEIEGKQIGGVTITREHIKAVLLDIFIASVDTNVASMVWAMAELVKNPRVMKKVQDEVRSCAADKGKVDESDLDQLEYLKMVVKETLRLHPPAPLLIVRACTEECKIKGYDIYPSMMVLVNAWAIARDSENWKNPQVFIPERFMDRSTDFKGKDFEYLPFGAGRRGCPGMTMSAAIMELTLANLLYSFNWKLPDGMQIEDLDMEEAGAFALHKKSGLQIVPTIYDWQCTQEIS